MHENSTPNPVDENQAANAIQQLVDFLEAADGDDEIESYDDYERRISHQFPEECRELFGVTEISIPVRDLLEIWIKAQPEDSDRLRRIQREFYSGDKMEDYDWELSEDGHIPTRKRLAEIKVEREVHERTRAHNREKYGAASPDFKIVFEPEVSASRSEWDYLNMDHPFKSAQGSNEREYERLSFERQLLDSDWQAFVRPLAYQTNNGEPTVIEAKLNAREEAYEREWEDLCMHRSLLVDSIIEWELTHH